MELVDVTDSKSVGLIPRVGSSPTTGTIMNEPRFSNCFIEKRGSSYVESLVVRDFPLFVAPDLFFKILQMQKQYFYVGQRFRRYFPKSNKHYSLLVSCNLYKLILQ